MSKSCRFCEILNWNICENIKDHREEEFTVALVSHSIIQKEDGTWRRGGRVTDYRYKGIGYKLKYCPECGRKIKYEIRKRQQKRQAEKEATFQKEEAGQEA